MDIFNMLSYLGFLISIASIIGIAYHKKRISELTFAVGHLMDQMEELKKGK